MTPDLVAYLRRGALEPFVWGRADCCLWAADWIVMQRGIDPALCLRGRYRTAIGAARHIRRLGGFEAMVLSLAAEAGLSPTDTPIAGDVGLVDTDHGPAMAIRTANRWAGKAPRGIVVAPFGHRLAWSV